MDYPLQNTATVTATYSPSETSERESIIKEFEWAITDLQKVVGEFQIRLQPVLRPLGPENEAGQGQDVPLASDARARLYDLHGTTAHLRALLNRLEV